MKNTEESTVIQVMTTNHRLYMAVVNEHFYVNMSVELGFIRALTNWGQGGEVLYLIMFKCTQEDLLMYKLKYSLNKIFDSKGDTTPVSYLEALGFHNDSAEIIAGKTLKEEKDFYG